MLLFHVRGPCEQSLQADLGNDERPVGTRSPERFSQRRGIWNRTPKSALAVEAGTRKWWRGPFDLPLSTLHPQTSPPLLPGFPGLHTSVTCKPHLHPRARASSSPGGPASLMGIFLSSVKEDSLLVRKLASEDNTK